MTTQNHYAINWCPDCEIEYSGHRCAPCPLCPLRAAWNEADVELRHVEPWRVIQAGGVHEMQEILNELSASGWKQDSFHVSHKEDSNGVRPVYVAVLQRTSYDPESHVLRRLAQQKATKAYFAKQEEIATEVETFRAARNGETS